MRQPMVYSTLGLKGRHTDKKVFVTAAFGQRFSLVLWQEQKIKI